ncbi:P-loop containing nucleoside triphosphate hydrolase protein [Radiomyces spectabilis]|uniref:P-loop containing nucleoside triphosphate hydrolase protein n=1 Tax=Radiomyces spectabilis TaxID=64574 RepID=UPI00221F6C9C|nr:P-loop containing nucleoside triphosphate hydrolase protein [Radiomyces spectabilis]KAI8381524.1 P-loop containing nucleoside triphosphate hydrolase protein [Radiomyces spectabilis]
MEIPAGAVDLELSHAGHTPTLEWQPFRADQWTVLPEYQTYVTLIDRLQKRRRMRAMGRCIRSNILRVQIFLYIIDESGYVPPMGSYGRVFLEFMQRLNRDPHHFDGILTDQHSHQSVFPTESKKTLLDMFIEIPSPCEKPLPDCDEPNLLHFLHDCTVKDCPDGMKTSLYRYQKNAVWKILQRELAPQKVVDAANIPMVSVDNTPYYFDQLLFTLTAHPPLERDIQGGIICEDMGTGKTCICLAVIMATKDLSHSLQRDHIMKTDIPKTSLRNIAADQILRHGVSWRGYGNPLPFDAIDLMKQHPAYYEWTDVPYSFYDRPRRREIEIPVMRVYGSHATLVVVPDNLVAQWTGEVYKHIQDTQMDFLILDDPKKKVPEATSLIGYDMVLISQTRFSREHAAGGFDFEGIPRICQCPYIGATRIRDCHCPPLTAEQAYISPLLQVHWKRMIVDEGHRLSTKNKQSELSAKLFSTWKWICTGTPTQNLTESAAVYNRRQEGQVDDLNRLGLLLGPVLQMEPFYSDRKLWNIMVTKPFMSGKPWAASKMQNVMSRCMIRNRRQDIEAEVKLPPLHQRKVFLDFDYYQWLAHNCQIAMIGLNAILSKREGPDYLFSKNNTKALRETVHNLWQSCLWHSIDLRWLQASYENCIEKIHDVDCGREDYGDDDTVLRQIQQVLKRALDDKMFMQMMTQHSPSFVVQGLPNLMKQKWGWVHGDHGAYEPLGTMPWEDHCIVNGDIVIDLMHDVLEAKDEFKNLYVYNGTTDTLESTQTFYKKEKKAAAEQNKKPLSLDLSEPKGAKETEEPVEQQLTFYTGNAFSDARVLCSTSSKINYLVNEICKYQAQEKCIVFSQHYNEIQEIYLALKLAKIRTLMYLDSRMSNAARSQAILTFNTSENANVIIMAVQRAAFGIDLSSATRVYFVSPVWQLAMEQQAIKRAHRIGQTKPVYIETLIIRDTIEDELLKRREVVSQTQQEESSDYAKTTEFYSDTKLRGILNHARFVPLPNHITYSPTDQAFHQKITLLKAPLYFMPSRKQDQEIGKVPATETPPVLDHETLDVELVEEDAKQEKPKKKRKVTFAI